MQDDKIAGYEARFGKVFDYINEHLDEPLSLERLSRVANFSKFHFHRQFSLYAGISAARYIQLMRLRRASYRLAFEDETRVIQIALEAGFENPESFSRAFKQAFGQTPTQFREDAAWQPWNQQFQFPVRTRTANMDVKIIEFPETRVAVLEHQGPPETVNDTARRFIQWRKETGLSPVSTSLSLGLAYDDPATAEPASFRFDLCGSVKSPVPANRQGVINKVIPAGRCAVVRHYGSHDCIGDGAYFLYRQWLPQSGEELRDFPLFFQYHNLMPETAEHELITDIHLPLQG
ncbi:AraC family transcriptional regulator [Alcanivorax hongdengensis A-11-3]|uniref:AraC family transcriptional regulator n=1 Tax=Alcanivorax hongdengensis A-11-3 TaxID=1177179 RepID=L0WJI0_9GAMM|nr:AraC family transcriptional regulator [Alcanivorax hongdengensis]EKF75985.1 AraC family transcriptional regulator [Alcanivorax hongdengensis A-11-3]